MEILPPLQATINFVTFLTHLIDLKQFNTILVLYDQTTQNEINFVIETLPTRYDIAWLLVYEDYSPKYWKLNPNMLILTAVKANKINSVLGGFYNKKILSKLSKNLIVSSNISKLANEILSPLFRREINAVLTDWASEECVIFAWNPYGARNLVKLNGTEFLRSSNAAVSESGMYSGLFFDQLQNMRGKSTNILSSYDSKNVYNVVSRDLVAGVEGTEIQIFDLIGEAIQSPMDFYVIKTSSLKLKIEAKMIDDFLERTYRTFATIQPRRFQDLTVLKWIKIRKENKFATSGYSTSDVNDLAVYPHSFENYVIVVQHNTKITATAFQRIFVSPIIYLWISFIVLFVVVRCGLQWINESASRNSVGKRRRCVLMCEDTVQLSCGVVMNIKLFASKRYLQILLAHGATIIPLIAGMFISGLLYGDYLMQAEVPTIDSIVQLEHSKLTICLPVLHKRFFKEAKNKLIEIHEVEILGMIWSGNTSCAYMIPERFTSLLDMDHLRPNGRPMFHVIKERFVGKYVNLKTWHWFLYNRMNTIVMRSQENGLVKYFDSVSKRTFKQRTTQSDTADANSLVSKAGGLQEILIACAIFLVGISLGIVILSIELFLKRTSR